LFAIINALLKLDFKSLEMRKTVVGGVKIMVPINALKNMQYVEAEDM
jgi:hypothetical protein